MPFCGVSLIAGVEYGEWKMEWNSEHTQLELTHATGNVQSVELTSASLGLLSTTEAL